jgi:4-hydroxy-3-methylbut-2-enyl diphosphate reductase
VKWLSIRIAEHAGFCSGVREAVERALQEAARRGRVFTLGPLVHNEAVIDYLARHNVVAVNSPEEAAEGVLIIRTHGVPPAVLEQAGRVERLEVLDLTCPKVQRVQKLARKLAESGNQIIIFGDARHPEVKGVVGWAGEEAEIDVVASVEELRSLAIKPAAALIAQTTGDQAVYEELKALFLQCCPGGKVYDTLCPETGLRQREALRLASAVEAMVVVGSPASANTRALAEACRRLKPTVMVAGAGELDPRFLRKYRLIGVTAGASTPHWMIKEVVERMENEKLELGTGLAEEGPGEETVPKAEVMEGEMREGQQDQNQEVKAAAVIEEGEKERAEAEPEALREEAADASEAEDDLAEDFDFAESLNLVQVGEQVTGKVVRAEADEVYLDIGYKSEALLPAREVYLQEGEKLSDRFATGQEIEVTVIDVDEQESKVVVSHKRLAREKRWQELYRLLEEGATEEGRVKQVVNAGMVIDLGEGIEGFMPGSLVDLRYVPDFKPFLGQKVKFKVIEINREKDKVILSRKKVLEEENQRRKEETLRSLEVGSIIHGVVRRLTNFGAFVDVGGIDGLVHISEISWERVEHPQEVVKVGQEIEVKVLDVIPEKERISLSLRQTQPDPWTRAMQELKSGDIVKGRITRLVNFGAFVELRPGVEGLVHISQIADYHVKHPSDVLKEGEEVEVKVLELKPEAKRIGLSMKEVRKSTYNASPGEMESGDPGTVTLGDVFGDLFEQEVASIKEESSAESPEDAAEEE